jgi:hypothetical protein
MKAEGKNWIDNLRTKWIIAHLISAIVISFSITLVLSVMLVHLLNDSSWWSIPIFFTILIIIFWARPSWKITLKEVSRYVNDQYPQLEESAALLLQDRNELTGLQQLQQDKIQNILLTLPQPKKPIKRIYASLAVLVGAIVLSFLLSKIPLLIKFGLQEQQTAHRGPKTAENIPVTVADFEVSVVPPAYTGKSGRKQEQFSILAESGATVRWNIETNVPVKKFRLLFNDQEVITLKATNNKLKTFTYQKIITRPGFYQLEINGNKSDLYQIEIIPDLPVNIKITKPKQHTTIDIGEPQQLHLNIQLTDDYGIHDASISATLASGKGEGVSFTEKKLTFDVNFGNRKRIALSKLINLKSLGMKPGDELYFFIKAMDNHGQASRSDIYFVSIVDTTELMSMGGMTTGVNLVPEYFRSQRQIIIDTEKLLKEQSTLLPEAFKTRSNELGIDQKMLRLRYGKFLGEEDETEIGGEHEEQEGNGGEAKFGDVSAIMDKYAHKHDIAEDATFFEPELKAQLKAVLNEMWKSELRLRTYKPQEALPFEYKALRLLKDLQQKSRAYVAKTTVKKAALKPEKRLTGELDQITQPIQQMTFEQKEQRTTQLKKSITLLEGIKTGKKTTDAMQFFFRETEKYIIGSAADHPSTYLPALTSLRRIITSKNLNIKDIELVQSALQKMINLEFTKPQVQNAAPASTLYQGYFNNLKKLER